MASDNTVDLELKEWIKKVIKLVDVDIVNRKVLAALGLQVAARIRKRTRLAFGVENNKDKKKHLKKMRKHSKPYTKWRKANRQKLSSDTSPTRHNLTLTGKMLDSLRVIHLGSRNKSLTLGFSSKKQFDKAERNIERGWEFMHLSDVEIKFVNNFYKREVRKLVKQFNTR